MGLFSLCFIPALGKSVFHSLDLSKKMDILVFKEFKSDSHTVALDMVVGGRGGQDQDGEFEILPRDSSSEWRQPSGDLESQSN